MEEKNVFCGYPKAPLAFSGHIDFMQVFYIVLISFSIICLLKLSLMRQINFRNTETHQNWQFSPFLLIIILYFLQFSESTDISPKNCQLIKITPPPSDPHGGNRRVDYSLMGNICNLHPLFLTTGCMYGKIYKKNILISRKYIITSAILYIFKIIK